MPQFAVAVNQGADFGLEISTDGLVSLPQQRVGLSRFHLAEVSGEWKRLPSEIIPTARGAVQGDLIRAKNKAGKTVPRIGDFGHVAPGIGRVAGVHPDRIPVDAA